MLELSARGADARAQGEHPQGQIPDDLTDRVEAHEAELVEILNAPEAPDPLGDVCLSCEQSRWWKRRGGDYWVCGACHPPSLPPDEIVWLEEGTS